MKIELHGIRIRELVEGYADDPEQGVRAYGGRLDVRPPYQREFVYKDKERDAVISTVMKGFPLNVMYWVRKDDGTFEVMDGQQRTISLCRYFAGDFSWGEIGAVGGLGAKFFHRQPEDIQRKFLDYELMVYFCEGTPSEKIDWFRVINIAGLKLTDQEMRNAVYSGPWVTDAKRYFSKSGCVAAKVGAKYLNGSADRQDYLETAIAWWVNSAKDKAIEDYMAIHQGDAEAVELWLHFQKVVNWVETIFPKYRKEMKGLEWGRLYTEYGTGRYNPSELEGAVARLMADKEVQNNKGVYEYLLSGGARKEKLNLRAFDDDEKRIAYELQKGVCPKCGGHFAFEEMQGDHIVPWSRGGKTVQENCQMLCRRCNGIKSDN
ncbi:MAG: DUF262 domain-containing protein [Kiritimatiellae bacterium]|nr:DUF262 domain-containing protein [Kiritimatiellia bacterium]